MPLITSRIFHPKILETQGTRSELNTSSTLKECLLPNRSDGINSNSFRNTQVYPRKPKILEHHTDDEHIIAQSSNSKDDSFFSFSSSLFLYLMSLCQKVTDQIGALVSSSTHYHLLDFHELPAFLKHNKYILTKYRRVRTYAECWTSIFKIHNETINVWTHILGTVWFLYLGIALLYSFPLEVRLGDYMIFGWFFVCALKCFINSALFHVFQCHSPQAHFRFCCLDHLGINALICGSVSIMTYYGYFCQDGWRLAYLTLILLLGSMGWIVSMFPQWHLYEFRTHRTIFYLCLASILTAPTIHYLSKNGIPSQLDMWGIYGYPAMLVLYLIGVLIYATHFPER